MTIWTTKKVGDALSVSDRQIRNIAAALGITPAGEKFGNVPTFTEEQYRAIQKYHAKNNKRGPKPKGKKS